jgi:hypothetical protein
MGSQTRAVFGSHATPIRPSENETVTSGKVATNHMKKQIVVISTVFGIFTDWRQSMLREKPL